MSDFGKRLRSRRKKSGQTLHDVATAIDISIVGLSRIERGLTVPDKSVWEKLDQLLPKVEDKPSKAPEGYVIVTEGQYIGAVGKLLRGHAKREGPLFDRSGLLIDPEGDLYLETSATCVRLDENTGIAPYYEIGDIVVTLERNVAWVTKQPLYSRSTNTVWINVHFHKQDELRCISNVSDVFPFPIKVGRRVRLKKGLTTLTGDVIVITEDNIIIRPDELVATSSIKIPIQDFESLEVIE